MGGGGGGRLFEAGRLLTFSAFRMGAYSKWALIRGWALIRINTVTGTQNDRVVTHQGGSGWEIHQPGYMATGQTRLLLTKFGDRT